MYDYFPIIYITTSIVSIILAITAIWFSLSVESRLKKNFLHLKELIELHHSRTEELINSMENESQSIQSVVYDTHNEIHQTLQKMQEECDLTNSDGKKGKKD